MAAGGTGAGRGEWKTRAPSHLKELEEGVQLKKSWLIWRG